MSTKEDFGGFRDSLSPWWQLISLAPVVGILVLLYLLTYPTKAEEPVEATAG